MDSDSDDDIYGEDANERKEVKMEDVEDGEEEGEEVEDDSDVSSATEHLGLSLTLPTGRSQLHHRCQRRTQRV